MHWLNCITWKYAVDFRATNFGEKLEKSENKTHRFNVVRQITYVHKNGEEDFHYM